MGRILSQQSPSFCQGLFTSRLALVPENIARHDESVYDIRIYSLSWSRQDFFKRNILLRESNSISVNEDMHSFRHKKPGRKRA